MAETIAMPEEIRSRVNAAWSSCQLTPCEKDVLVLLTHPNGPRIGIKQALCISQMQEMLFLAGSRLWSDRQIKAAVKNLLETYHVPIGSSRSQDHPGFYVLANDSEVQSTVNVYLAEAKSLLRRCKTLSPNTDFVKGLLGQESLEEL